MRALPLVVVCSLCLAGCNSILGIGGDFQKNDAAVGDDDAPIDAPPNTVIGVSKLRYVSASGSEEVPEDLSRYTISALIPSAAASGFDVLPGTGHADGTFEIPNVQDGMTFYLKLLPASGATRYFVTSKHTLDLSVNVGGRKDGISVAASQPVHLQLTGMQPWKFRDFLVSEVYNTSTEDWDVEAILDTPPALDATGIDATYDWSNPLACYSYRTDSLPALITSTAGDQLEISHVRHIEQFDLFNRLQTIDRTIDLYTNSGINMTAGVSSTVMGAFTPVPLATSVRFIVNRAQWDAGYSPSSSFDHLTEAVFTSPGIDRNIFVGPPIVTVNFNDWSRNAQLMSTIDTTYGDPWPTAWPRVFFVEYNRFHWYKLPGTQSFPIVEGGRRFLPFAPPFPQGPDVQPVGGFMVAAQSAEGGGRITFNGTAPVMVTWNAVSSASAYQVGVARAINSGGRTRFQSAGTVKTTDHMALIPAEVFTGGEFFVFTVSSIRNSGQFASGLMRDDGYPATNVQIASGMFRLLPSCGDGAVQSPEQCDPGAGGATATCDIDCTPRSCGDGIVNAVAGEACDTIQNTPACDADCTLPMCGDGFFNEATEDCDDGNTTQENNGCSTTCKAVNMCGNNHLEDQVEECEDGNAIDDGNGCGANCRRNDDHFCGDGTKEAIERCDDGNNDAGDMCSPDCRVITTTCGNSTVDTANGEQCEPPNAANCNAWCAFI